jgi:hypothetical protein
MGMNVANKVVKRAYKELTSAEEQHGFLDFSGLMPPNARKGVDYWTSDDQAMLKAFLIMNRQTQIDKGFMGKDRFGSLTFHMPIVRVTYSPQNVKEVTLYPFNYWSLRKIPGAALENVALHNVRAFSWITLGIAEKSEYMSSI